MRTTCRRLLWDCAVCANKKKEVFDKLLGLLWGWGCVRVREESVNGVEDVLHRPLLVSDGARGSPEGDIVSVYHKTDISKCPTGGQVPSSPG